jgi:translation initiation factor IF-3
LDENKNQLGVMSLNEALRIAMSKGMDLVEVAATATPPVCRIVDYGKFLYEESKRTKDSKSRQPANRMKELQLSASIDPHDVETKRNHAIQFLCDEMKVRIKLRFRGRQRAHKDIGFDIVKKFVADLAAYGQADAPPKMLGDRDLSVVISPLARDKRAKNPKGESAPASSSVSRPPEQEPASEA